MSNSESQNRKGKGGRKPKFDYTSEDFLSLVESYAKKGFTDKEIAHAIGLSPHICAKRSSASMRRDHLPFFIDSLFPFFPFFANNFDFLF